MPLLAEQVYFAYQAGFQRNYGHLTDPHVRDLAWLLDSPDLLDQSAPQWHGQIATLFNHVGPEIAAWLLELDHQPEALHALINKYAFARLGRYSELLMVFFFRYLGILHAHGLQVREEKNQTGKNQTIGEFDFLLWDEADSPDRHLLHWEFATKFYLLQSDGTGDGTDCSSNCDANDLVGPNLADSLGAKMRKILERQLSLSRHPAAQIHLPQQVAYEQALVKGWLFYPWTHAMSAFFIPGVSAHHCRGFWCALAELNDLPGEYYAILPRLSWLAPARMAIKNCLTRQELRTAMHLHFANDASPAMIALMELHDDVAIELARGFIVPNDWRHRANFFVKHKQSIESIVD